MLTLKSRVATRAGGVDRNFEGGAEGGGLLDVATREGGVDRNPFAVSMTSRGCVATREGGVDRNWDAKMLKDFSTVATREGGVDRNLGLAKIVQHPNQSPPARVAWIETKNPHYYWSMVKRRHPRGWRG